MLNGKIDKSVPIPLYFQLKEIIIGEIKNGNYEKDAIIPTEKEFIEHYQINNRIGAGRLVIQGEK